VKQEELRELLIPTVSGGGILLGNQIYIVRCSSKADTPMRATLLMLILLLLVAAPAISSGLSEVGHAWPESQRSSVPRKPSSAELASIESSCFKGVLNSVALYLPLLAYPPQAARRGIGGKVRIRVFVDEKGAVYYASVVDGPSSLRKVSLQSARESRFAPFTKDEKPIKCAGLLVYTFNPPK
jgi:TonB family protein